MSIFFIVFSEIPLRRCWRIALVLGFGSALLAGCGGSPMAGPSPVAPPAAIVAAPTRAVVVPVSMDPAYVHTLAERRWEGGPFHHCFSGADAAALEPVMARLTALSGIPRTEVGPCNVEWIVNDGLPRHTETELRGTATVIVSVRVFLRHASDADTLHEAGHVLGLAHSPHSGDLMAATPHVQAFSADELAVLAWMYGR